MDIISARHALYALISAIEQDLRRFVFEALANIPVNSVVSGAQQRKATGRLLADEPTATALELEDLLPYLDLPDLQAIIRRQVQSSIETFDKEQAGFIDEQIENIIPIRHRVAHTRPLLLEDLPNALIAGRALSKRDKTIWVETSKTLRDARTNPERFLSLDLPSEADQTVLHNLPAPDFDETGFVGRDVEVTRLCSLCKGPYPIVTIVGEGGLGKTALALKVAYDLMDDPDEPFEILIWASSKTAQLTSSEIVRIEGAIENSLGLLQNIEFELAGKSSDDSISEILEYMKSFRTLLILDNLETVLDERLKRFFGELPNKSKILITSRIGIGAFEYPFQLESMSTKESVQFLKALAKARAVKNLTALPESMLDAYCRRMKNNPGFIKWFVSAVQTGKRPEDVLVKPDVFLDFCMSNVYEYLEEGSIDVLRVLQCIPESQTQAELAFITEKSALELQKALQQLLTSNMIRMKYAPVGESLETRYEIGELARPFLNKRHPPPMKVSKYCANKRRQVTSLEEQYKWGRDDTLYMYEHVHCRTKRDALVAKHLQDAIKATKRQSFERAKQFIDIAKNLAPDYFEVYRVEAQTAYFEGNYPLAKDSYEAAVELESNWAPLRYLYAGFMLRNQEDVSLVLDQLEIARKLDPSSIHIGMEIARCYVYLHRFSTADDLLRQLWKTKALEAWARRKLIDLTLQLLTRRAEEYVETRDHVAAMKDYLEVKKFVDKCTPELIDSRIERILIKTAVTYRRLVMSSISIPTLKDDFKTYAIWLHARFGKPATITENSGDGNHKFSATIDGEEYDFGIIVYLSSIFDEKLENGSSVMVMFDRYGRITSMVPSL